MKTTEEKKNKIKQTISETRLKRKIQKCMVFELKIDSSHLNKEEKEKLKMFFVEAKWLYNYILSLEDPFNFDTKIKTITVKNKDKVFEERQLKHLPAKNRQDVYSKIMDSIKGLSISKRSGRKVGKLKFKSEYSTIELSQYGVTHKIVDKNKIKINGIKRPLRIRGLDQIKSNYEVANAKLIKKPSGYYIHLNCYTTITLELLPKRENSAIGLDFGIKNNITTSDGEVLNISIGESKRLKNLQRKQSRSSKGSNNRYKLRTKLQKAYESINNRKKDVANKFVSKILHQNQVVCIQDENLKGWHKGWFGKQVQRSAMGLIKAKLIQSKQTIVVDRYFPTTKQCYKCGNMVIMALDERIFYCNKCGLVEDRDIKAAKTILLFGLGSINYIRVPTEHRDFKPVEINTSIVGLKNLTTSRINEAGCL